MRHRKNIFEPPIEKYRFGSYSGTKPEVSVSGFIFKSVDFDNEEDPLKMNEDIDTNRLGSLLSREGDSRALRDTVEERNQAFEFDSYSSD